MTFKRIILILLTTMLILSVMYTNGVASVLDEKNIVGSYFSMGTYGGIPIIWRAVKTENDGILLVSDEIICFKAYDENSARWSTSDIRHWLNSETENTQGTYNEKGFLCNDNFTEAEKRILKDFTHFSVLNENDAAYATSGEKAQDIKAQPIVDEEDLKLSYRESAEDKIFLPSISEIALLNSYDFGIEYNMATPTEFAASNSDFGAKHGANWYYWLSDAVSFSDNTSLVRMSSVRNTVTYTASNTENVGIRPMCCISDDYFILNGNGSKKEPFKVSGEEALFISSDEFYVLEGKGFNVQVVSKPDNLKISKYINDEKVSDDNFVAKAGINEVLFTAENYSGDIVYTSNKLTFYGVSFKNEATIWERDFETGNVFDGFSKEVYSDAEDAALIVRTDEIHGKSLQFKAYDSDGTKVNANAQTVNFSSDLIADRKTTKLTFDFKLSNTERESLVVMKKNSGGFYWPVSVFNGVLNIKSVKGECRSLKIETDTWYNMQMYFCHKEGTITVICGKEGKNPSVLCYNQKIDADEFSYTLLAEFTKGETSTESFNYFDNIGIYTCVQNECDDLFISDRSYTNSKVAIRLENPTGGRIAEAWLYKANFSSGRLLNAEREIVGFKNGERFVEIEIPKTDGAELKTALIYKNMSPVKLITEGK